MNQNIVINNLECSLGQKKDGVQNGGSVIIDNLSNSKIKKINNISFLDNSGYLKSYQIIQQNLGEHFCLNLGGDHSVGVSTIQPVLDKYHDDVLIVWIDAHADINTPETSPSQNTHGMPVAALLGLMNNWIDNNHHHKLQPNNIVYVGIRDLDLGEINFVQNLSIKNFPVFNCDVLDYIKHHPAKHIHISCDIDGIDPVLMPSTGTKATNGLDISDVLKIIKESKDKLISFDLVEFNPNIGTEKELKTTLDNILLILNNLLED